MAMVAERLDCSLPTKAKRAHSPAGSLPDFRKWESYRTIPLAGGFSRGSAGTPCHFIPALLHTHLTSPSPALKNSMTGWTPTYCAFDQLRPLVKKHVWHASENSYANNIRTKECIMAPKDNARCCWLLGWKLHLLLRPCYVQDKRYQQQTIENGGGNPVNNGDPVDEDDCIARDHDIAYDCATTSEEVGEAVSKFTSDFIHNENFHSTIGAAGLGINYGLESLTVVQVCVLKMPQRLIQNLIHVNHVQHQLEVAIVQTVFQVVQLWLFIYSHVKTTCVTASAVVVSRQCKYEALILSPDLQVVAEEMFPDIPCGDTDARLHHRGSNLDPGSDLRSTLETVAPFEFRAGLEIEMKFISNHQKFAVRNLDQRSAAIVDKCVLFRKYDRQLYRQETDDTPYAYRNESAFFYNEGSEILSSHALGSNTNAARLNVLCGNTRRKHRNVCGGERRERGRIEELELCGHGTRGEVREKKDRRAGGVWTCRRREVRENNNRRAGGVWTWRGDVSEKKDRVAVVAWMWKEGERRGEVGEKKDRVAVVVWMWNEGERRGVVREKRIEVLEGCDCGRMGEVREKKDRRAGGVWTCWTGDAREKKDRIAGGCGLCSCRFLGKGGEPVPLILSCSAD
ncbi:hypothetical protein PR048_030179 [Dryococelus australis]|uniref:Uncharacterized protein n=1 Tax=Dryococelus australis TaxID=614101 RepID=A0ABQ9G881_9NEOP|nr:hypothetical protein PR048_030179 [Dryococelus australis]